MKNLWAIIKQQWDNPFRFGFIAFFVFVGTFSAHLISESAMQRTIRAQRELIAALNTEVAAENHLSAALTERVSLLNRILQVKTNQAFSDQRLLSSISVLEGVKMYKRKLAEPELSVHYSMIWTNIADTYNAIATGEKLSYEP